MPLRSVRALVLRKTKLGETDTIVTMLGSDGYQLRAVAKGMRKPGSRLGGRLEPYSVVDLLLHIGRSLDVVTEAESVRTHAALREDFDRSTAAGVVVDVLDKVSVEGQGEQRLFGLTDATLTALEDVSAEGLELVVVAFLGKIMAMQGYRPELDSCACCAEHAAGGRLFSLVDGGVLCPGCGDGTGAALHFSEEGRVLLGKVLGATMPEVVELADTVDHVTVRECFDLLRGFVGYHVPARLRALDFYAGMQP
ncbi:MAG: DNA repair protein RecO [Actinomycetota bacterium]|nr:DNA repair protein RecO [Actinomycetota bacterium]MDZ4180018.1 DNA repair protein RecO [Coriobacteriia bacterium]